MDNRAMDPIPTPSSCSTQEDTIHGSCPCCWDQPGGDGGGKLKGMNQGLCAQGQHQHGRFWLSSSKELVAKSPGERAGREVGELRNRSEHQGFNCYPEVILVTLFYN